MNNTGSRIALGSINHKINGVKVGQARAFELQNNTWVQLGNSINGTTDNNTLGHSVSLNVAGNILAVGDPFAFNSTGELKIYRLENNNWVAFWGSNCG